MFDFLLWIIFWSIGLLCSIYFAKKVFFPWQRTRKYARIIKILNKTFQEIDPFTLSLQAREGLLSDSILNDIHYANNTHADSSILNDTCHAKNAHHTHDSNSLTYGEVSVCALLDLLKESNIQANDIFYDLGSGIGKTLVAVKLCYPTLNVHGIEILPSLHQAALSGYDNYLALNGLTQSDFKITYILGDFFNYSFKDANIIFINGTGYHDERFKCLLPKLLSLKTGTKIIVTSKTLPETEFIKISQSLESMSWGWASTYIYQKK